MPDQHAPQNAMTLDGEIAHFYDRCRGRWEMWMDTAQARAARAAASSTVASRR